MTTRLHPWSVRRAVPFRLVRHDPAVAREHLVPDYDQRRLGPATTLDDLLDMLEAHGTEADLR
ncbi:hypothetical protein ACFYOT_19590 [Saccharothrix saharensis]|uniref:hypothetical protein n=1 Tax=Saccharothrix saharensis TaxID=571190 RepID=UPI00368FC0CA